MPRNLELPDDLTLSDGTTVSTPRQLEEYLEDPSRSIEILQRLEDGELERWLRQSGWQELSQRVAAYRQAKVPHDSRGLLKLLRGVQPCLVFQQPAQTVAVPSDHRADSASPSGPDSASLSAHPRQATQSKSSLSAAVPEVHSDALFDRHRLNARLFLHTEQVRRELERSSVEQQQATARAAEQRAAESRAAVNRDLDGIREVARNGPEVLAQIGRREFWQEDTPPAPLSKDIAASFRASLQQARSELSALRAVTDSFQALSLRRQNLRGYMLGVGLLLSLLLAGVLVMYLFPDQFGGTPRQSPSSQTATPRTAPSPTTESPSKAPRVVAATVPPTRPTLISPGSTSGPGIVTSGTSPTMEWSSVPGATGYGLYVSAAPYGRANLVYENETIPGDATSIVLPSGVLRGESQYRWNMRARNSAGWSEFSERLYFQVSAGSEASPRTASPREYPGPRIRELLLRAEQEFERGQYKTALAYCDQALQLDPNHQQAKELRAKIQKTMEILGVR